MERKHAWNEELASSTSNVSKQFRFERQSRGRAVESGTKRVVIKADNANARETEKRKKLGGARATVAAEVAEIRHWRKYRRNMLRADQAAPVVLA